MSLEFAQGNTSQNSQENEFSGHRLADIHDAPTTAELPVSSFRDVKNMPYSAVVFKYDDYAYIDNHPALAKVEPTYNAVNAIDDYIIYMMRLNELSDTKESYYEVLGELEESLGLSKNLDPKIRLAKLAKVAILKMKREKNNARYKIIQKQYGNTSTKSPRSNRIRLT